MACYRPPSVEKNALPSVGRVRIFPGTACFYHTKILRGSYAISLFPDFHLTVYTHSFLQTDWIFLVNANLNGEGYNTVSLNIVLRKFSLLTCWMRTRDTN